MSTRARLLTINCRRSTITELFPSRRWSKRKPYFIKFLRHVDPSVICVQECTGQQVFDIVSGLGAHWNFYGEPSNRQVLWDTRKWDVLDDTHTYHIPESKTDQTATFAHLERRETKATIWIVSVHLTVGSTNSELRKTELKAVFNHLKTLPGWETAVVAGDLNSSSLLGGARSVAIAAGFKPLRGKCKTIDRKHYSTVNHFRVTKQDDYWVDEVLTPVLVNPYYAAVELTDPTVYQVAASDHNGIRCSFEF